MDYRAQSRSQGSGGTETQDRTPPSPRKDLLAGEHCSHTHTPLPGGLKNLGERQLGVYRWELIRENPSI